MKQVDSFENIDVLLKRIFIFLEDGDWEKADLYCERALDADPKNGQVYLGKLMAELHVHRIQDFATLKTTFDSSKNYQKIIQWGEMDLVEELESYIQQIKAAQEQNRVETKLKRAKRYKWIKIGATITIPIAIILVLVVNMVIPMIDYKQALKLYNIGEYEEAAAKFEKLDGYKESRNYLTLSSIKAAKVGDIAWMGEYEQDNNTSNGKERIEWLVLEKSGNKVLLLSNKALDYMEYNVENELTTWENCTLRRWLNQRFYEESFDDKEKKLIETTSVVIDVDDSSYLSHVNLGNDTRDKVFLLSEKEAKKYLGYNEVEECEATEYAISQGEGVTLFEDSNLCIDWWLRSLDYKENDIYTAHEGSSFADVAGQGGVSYEPMLVSFRSAVRPAIWVTIK